MPFNLYTCLTGYPIYFKGRQIPWNNRCWAVLPLNPSRRPRAKSVPNDIVLGTYISRAKLLMYLHNIIIMRFIVIYTTESDVKPRLQ